MKRVLTALVLIPLVLVVLFWAPLWVFGLILGLTAVITTREYLNIVQAQRIVPFRRLTLWGTGAIFVVMATSAVPLEYTLGGAGTAGTFRGQAWQAILDARVVFLSLPLLFLIRGLARRDLNTVLPGASASTLSFAYICLPLLAVFSIRYSSAVGATLVLYVFVTVWVGDIAAYYVGRSFGRRRLALAISPNKSWEGALASFAAAGVAGAVFLTNLGLIDLFFSALHQRIYQIRSLDLEISAWLALLLSFGINIAAQLGDLVESMLKRGAGVKDSGNLLPGHGGMLDRIDALLFAAPVLWYYATFRLIPF